MSTLTESIVSAASQGAAGAIIGAVLASVTDPITNRLLVRRMTLPQAINDVDFAQCVKYFQTTLPTNFIKFPVFEVLNVLMKEIDVPDSLRGVVTGALFTTATLPLTNYRFAKSMGEEVSMSNLWKAYLPTVVRDIVYAQARNAVTGYLSSNYPELQKTLKGRAIAMFITVVIACMISSPGNEWRGYVLQPEGKKKPMLEFFQAERYLRSTLIGSIVMGLSLGFATAVTPTLQAALPKLKDQRVIAGILLGLILAKKFKEETEGFPCSASQK